MIFVIFLSVILASCFFGLSLSKFCFGNMDEQYYQEVETKSEQEDIDNIILFGLGEEGENCDE